MDLKIIKEFFGFFKNKEHSMMLFCVVFLIAGILFLFFGIFEVKDIHNIDLETKKMDVALIPACIGLMFVTLMVVFMIMILKGAGKTKNPEVYSVEHSFRIKIMHATIEVCFGTLQNLYQWGDNSCVVFPVNEHFNSNCFKDINSALGSFCKQSLSFDQFNDISEALKKWHSEKSVNWKETTTGIKKAPKGTPFFHNIQGIAKMVLLAVTSVTIKNDIQCKASNICNSVEGLYKLDEIKGTNKTPLNTVVIPLLGTGKGGIPPLVSLNCMLIAFVERIKKKPSGNNIKLIRIIVFQRDKDTESIISHEQVRELLSLAQKY
ncbi:MAG: hypothetical protein HQK91_01725 [Nitrospirae bacterium]|nr:hypothetical protein [Nitrospirota bacterium]